jgi:hypothetical protein
MKYALAERGGRMPRRTIALVAGALAAASLAAPLAHAAGPADGAGNTRKVRTRFSVEG